MIARPYLAPPAMSASSEETENPLVLTRSEWHSEQLDASSGGTERSTSAAWPVRVSATSAAGSRKRIILNKLYTTERRISILLESVRFWDWVWLCKNTR